MQKTPAQLRGRQSLVNVLGVVYVHVRTDDGGDLYLTRFAKSRGKHLELRNWYERSWFKRNRVRLAGTSSVYRVPTRPVGGASLDLVVKNCRVGEDVPLDTHTLQEFCDREFNSPWEEFSLVMEMREGDQSPRGRKMGAQRPLAIYVPPERMQPWQSGRSRSRINRIRARHPGIDLDILKQYKMVYEWIRGKNLIEVFEGIDLPMPDIVHYLQAMQGRVVNDLSERGYLVADMKPEHVIIDEGDCMRIGKAGADGGSPKRQVELLSGLVEAGAYSVVDYELLFRTPDHEDRVKSARRHCYLDDQRRRFEPTAMPDHLSCTEILGVPYVYGHAESTGGHLWVVGRNARLFDYFLPERWRKTPALSLSESNEVLYTITKDNIHLVWKTSRVGELPEDRFSSADMEKVRRQGINSPFEEFAIAYRLNRLGIHAVYVRAIYMTGGPKLERSRDRRKYDLHRDLRDAEGNPILREDHNYITIRGYYNGPDEWVPEHENALYTPTDLARAVRKGILNESQSADLLKRVVARLGRAGYDGSLLRPDDLLIARDGSGALVTDPAGEPDVIICNFELIWRLADQGTSLS